MNPSRGRLAATTVAAAVATATAVLAAPGASAQVFDHFGFAFSDQSTFDDCGFAIVDDFTINGHTVIRTVKGTGTLFFATISRHTEDVLTNPATGAWFRVTSDDLYTEGGPVEELAPGVYRYTVRDAGSPVVVWDSAGHQVARDSGLLTYRLTFDTEGDDVPGGTELGSELVGVAGPHPLLDGDFCAIAEELIG